MRFLLSAIDFSDISTNIGNICVVELLGTFQNEISCLFQKTRHRPNCLLQISKKERRGRCPVFTIY